MPDSLSLVWDHSVHFAKFPIFKTLQLQQFSLDPIQTLCDIAYHGGMQAITVLFLAKFMLL